MARTFRPRPRKRRPLPLLRLLRPPAVPAPKAEPRGEQKFVAPKFAEPKPFHGEYGYRHAYGYGSGYGYARRAPHCH